MCYMYLFFFQIFLASSNTKQKKIVQKSFKATIEQRKNILIV